MKSSTTIKIAGIITILLAGGIAWGQNAAKQPYQQSLEQAPTTSAPHETLNPGVAVNADDDSDDDGVSTVTTVPTKAPAPVPAPGAKTYTMADVAKHNSGTSCWTAINGGVYDVTSWINQHPGGAQAILSLCGIDGSAAFNGQHGGQARPESELATFKIGTLVK